MRSFVLASMLLVAGLAPATAGDFAERNLLGFSGDGARFAFEEFGVQDGSGFPYANVTVIDTTKGKRAEGSPVRAVIEDETATIAAVRHMAAERAAPMLEGIDNPGTLLASNPITESGRAPYHIVFKRHPEQLLPGPDLSLRLDKFPLDAPDNHDPFYKTYGFRLVLKTDKLETIVHEDQALPASRGTPLDYRINDVVIYQRFGQPATLVVVIMVLRRGFEGPDGRYIAVSAQLPD
ncbi:DUF2259 domain-containing protein [Kaistia dalseonensis]|uniref:Secreted protein n=1 Tax=Kaistia dalseonensis TaxID=410840 RepID=A0ABU0HBD6_9HYPH|nr:DUF2259 domain-containing protein [Kaistia dalseonensis]MCX5497001.1 DUF2259 domain-containing protein [Kaistia dalseonensis]MDQ0439627.1 putative secreted protein [Kaistia dalseonensis]